jgi:hypothetical protein
MLHGLASPCTPLLEAAAGMRHWQFNKQWSSCAVVVEIGLHLHLPESQSQLGD